MIVFFFALIVLALAGATCQWRNGLDLGYLAKDRTTAVNGFFIGWVYLRHVCDSLTEAGCNLDGWLDKSFMIIDGGASQFIVVMFLFSSGYGVMTSIQKKGGSYVEMFPRKRILKVLLDFDIAIALYWAFQFFVTNSPKVGQALLALTGWTAIGNSNWYIFDILVCYAFVWISYKCLSFLALERAVIGLLFAGVVMLSCLKGYWWYDTLLVFGFGMVYATHKSALERFLQGHWWRNIVLAVLGFGAFRYTASLTAFPAANGLLLNIAHIFIAVAMVLLLMRVKIGNPAIAWMGANLFPIYIYQRLAMMIVLAVAGSQRAACHPYLFVAVAFALTAVFAMIYQKVLRVKL